MSYKLGLLLTHALWMNVAWPHVCGRGVSVRAISPQALASELVVASFRVAVTRVSALACINVGARKQSFEIGNDACMGLTHKGMPTLPRTNKK